MRGAEEEERFFFCAHCKQYKVSVEDAEIIAL